MVGAAESDVTGSFIFDADIPNKKNWVVGPIT